MRWLVAVLVGAGLTLVPGWCAHAAVPGADLPSVQGNGRVFVVSGSGAGSGGSPDAGSGPDCTGCAPTITTPVCVVDRFGTPPAPGAPCMEVPGFCPEGQQGRRVWTGSGTGWSPGSTFCAAVDQGVPVAVIRARVSDLVRHRVVSVAPTHQPAGVPLVRLPVLFDSGQPGGPQSWTDDIAGLSVTTTVRPSWHWDFGDGGSLTTEQPGSTYPDQTVGHPYETPGRYTVSVTTTWDGTFSVAGGGSFPIGGSVRQDADLAVRVATAQAVLVPLGRASGPPGRS